MSEIFYQIDLLGSALNASEKSHRVVSQNIANVNTPGYKTKQLDFETLMEQLAQGGEEQSSAEVELPVDEVEGLAERLDGNNVNLEKEVAKLKQNALAFQTYSQLLSSRVSTMRRAISG
jgi:flagellar basal-body rod protein FlgB